MLRLLRHTQGHFGRRIALGLVIALGVATPAMLLPAVAAGQDPGVSGSTSSSGAKPLPEDQSVSAYRALKKLGDSTEAGTFGGVDAVDDGASFIVYLAGDASKSSDEVQATKEAFNSAAHGYSVEFRETARTEAELRKNHQTLTNALSVTDPSGTQVTKFYADPATGREMVGVAKLDDATTRMIADVLPSGSYSLFEEPMAVTTTLYRFDDISGFNAGDFIYDPAAKLACSSAFAITLSGGQSGILTAAHCFERYAAIKNAVCIPYIGSTVGCPSSGSGNASIGNVGQRSVVANGLDSEVIYASGSALSFYASPFSSSYVTIAGEMDLGTGYTVCNSGAYSGKVCGATINTVDACVTFGDGAGPPSFGSRRICHLNFAYFPASAPAIANEDGDSGGPVTHNSSNGGVYALGTVIGAESGTTVSCDYFTSDLTCYRALYYQTLDYILPWWNATLNTIP